MNTEITGVNIICPHCGKDSYWSFLIDTNAEPPVTMIETVTRKCGNCQKQFKTSIEVSVTTEKE